jgi:type I restriction enzyme S subunit
LQSVICYEDDILVTRTGSTGKIITGVKGCFHNNFFKVNCFENIINKRYMYCVLNSKVMFGKLLHAASGGTVPDLPHNKFYKITIPVPSKEEQERIVSILDKFDVLTTSISEGLPKEIELRKKQYEYYRNQLLMFND